MKKFLAMLMAVAMVFSIVTVPVIAEPEDTASKKTESSQPVEPQDASPLDEALNAPGGTLTFTSEGDYPWEVYSDGDRSAAKSSNEGVSNSSSAVSTTVTVAQGDILKFDFQSHGEGTSSIYDGLILYVDGNEIIKRSIVEEWTSYSTSLSAGEHTITWEYKKDGSVNNPGDYATVDNVCICAPIHPESVEVEDISVPAGRLAKVQYTVLPPETTNKEVTFATADASIATVDENGRVHGVAEGTTTITVTTVDGNVSGTADVTVTEAIPYTEIFGYILEDPNNDENTGCWGTFADYDPSMITTLGSAQETLAAASTGRIIYGFGTSGFYYIDITDEGTGPVYLGIEEEPMSIGVYAMAFDYNTQTMYAIAADFEAETIALYTVDLSSGALTQVNTFDTAESIMNLAIDENGVGYTISSEGTLYTVDLDDAGLTPVGSTGLSSEFPFHPLTYDMNTHQLFWALNGEDGKDGLYTVDIATDTDIDTVTVTSLGRIGTGALVGGLLTLNDMDAPEPYRIPTFEIASENAYVGEEVVVPVVLHDYKGNANGLRMAIYYDTEGLAITDIEKGEFLTGTDADVSVFTEFGRIYIELISLTAPVPAPEGTDSITIVNLHFKVLNGAAYYSSDIEFDKELLQFTELAEDGSYNPIYFNAKNGAVSGYPVEIPDPTISLNDALNVEGGDLVFTTEGEYPWVVYSDGDRSAAKSSNAGVDESISSVSTTVTVAEGDILQFDFMSFGEKYNGGFADGLKLYIDDMEIPVEEWDIVKEWTGYVIYLATIINPDMDEHTIEWTYEKDESESELGDYAIIDNVYVGRPIPPSSVEVEDISVPAGRLAEISYTVLPDCASSKDVTFATADASIAIIENGRVRGVAEGTTTLTVNTSYGGVFGTATITVTEAPTDVEFMGYIVNDPDFENECWVSFMNNDTSTINYRGSVPITYAAASVGRRIYGFNYEDDSFYYIDTTDENMTPKYLPIISDRNVVAMAFDYETETMYAIAYDYEEGLGLYTVDRAIGTLTKVGIFDTYETIKTFAIGENSECYAISCEGNLYKVDLANAGLTLVGETGLNSIVFQSITYDKNTRQFFWALDDQNGNDGLYTIDPKTAESSFIGRIGTVDGGSVLIFGLLTLNDIVVPEPELPEFNVTFVDGHDGTTISTVPVDAFTVLGEDNFPTPPTHDGYVFITWDYHEKPIISDITVTAYYCAPKADTATIIFEVEDVWGDGSGYQFLLDSDATAYGSVFPAVGYLTDRGGAPAGVYEQFEYTLPPNADGSLITQNIVCGETVIMEIPAGTYDWCITNPIPGDCIYIATSYGTFGGRADDFGFKGGSVYYFHVYNNGNWDDAVDLETYHTITYTINDEAYTTQVYTEGEAISAPEYTVPEGHSFIGWAVPEVMPAESLVINATLTTNSYTVTYTIGGEYYTAVDYVYGTEVTEPEYPIPEGHSFTGWDIPETMPARDLTLDATLTINSYTITYTVNNEFYAMQTYEYGIEVIAPEYTDVPEGYNFSGWNIPETMPAENLILDAQCIINVYHVVFLDRDGSIISEQEVEHGAAALAPAAPEHVGLTFTGWSADFSVITSNCEIHALYDPIPHSGDINADGVVTTGDVTILMRHVLGFYNETLTPGQIAAADFNGDGVLNATDALLIARSTLGLLGTNATGDAVANPHAPFKAC